MSAPYVEPTDEEIAARFKGRYQRVPIGLRGGMLRYVDHGIPPGGFLTAVICNDLLEATGRAWIAKSAARAPYDGPIEQGMRFLWEGDKAHARCVVSVTGFGQVDGERTIRGVVEQVGPTTISAIGEENWNEESRFREAVVPFGGKL